jgi:hypothetical protein
MELLSPRRPEMFPLSNKPICTVTVLGVGITIIVLTVVLAWQ